LTTCPVTLIDLLTTLLSSTFRQILWKQALELDLTYSQAQVLFHLARNPKSLVTDAPDERASSVPGPIAAEAYATARLTPGTAGGWPLSPSRSSRE
jgi:hypothetical protein